MSGAVATTTLFKSGGSLAARLPVGFRIPGKRARIWRDGERVVLEPIKPDAWPEGFWESVHIDDPSFVRPPQPPTPPAPNLR